ncbi:MAG TPA: UDP-glucose 4-epimerase GalE, partial [Candidatus Acetothermia bacterium]|nr:UDP-glucose 4-epimerase GalE [Candidatus Acetothermia bacterium]
MILITGGAGYVGSHCVKELLAQGRDVVVFDNLDQGVREAVLTNKFVEGNLLRTEDLQSVFSRYEIDSVMHFAALASVGDSMRNPQRYYENNVIGTLNLLNAMRKHDVTRLIFSSSAAVYGDPEVVPIPEDHRKLPKNPYGSTKWMMEQAMADYAHAYGLHYIALRYFNAAGCDHDGQLGENHDPEEHLIPIVLDVALGRREALTIFGTDYETPDGTCVRDYVHVSDLATAHVLALDTLAAGGKSAACNLGIGNGYSVREVIESCRRVTEITIEAIEGPRRPGDPAVLVADPT